jgi:hypothetical protein
MSALDREISLAMIALDKHCNGIDKVTTSMTRLFVTGWLLSKGFPTEFCPREVLYNYQINKKYLSEESK